MVKNKKRKAVKGTSLRIRTFPKERKNIQKLTKEHRSIYPKKLLVSAEDKEKKAEIDKYKKELTNKRIVEAKRVTEQAASRIASMAASKLKQRAKSRRVLKGGRATLIIKEHEQAPYVPIFFKG